MSQSYWVEWNDAMKQHNFKLAKTIATEFYKEKGQDEYLRTFYYDAVFYDKYLSTNLNEGIDEIKSFYDLNPSVINEQSVSYCAYRLYKYANNPSTTLFRPKWILTIAQYDTDSETLKKLNEWITSVNWASNDNKVTLVHIVQELSGHVERDARLNKRIRIRNLAIVTTLVFGLILLLLTKISLISQGLL